MHPDSILALELMLSTVLSSVSQYSTHATLPSALDEGFKITHKGILCSAPIPSTAEVPRLRALFIFLKAMFTFVFWTIGIKTDYGLGMHGLRQWSVESLGYDGLCSHNPLRETVVGDIDLSAEELEELEQERKRKQTDRSSKSYKKMKLQSPERKREDARLATERFRTTKRETTRESSRKNTQKAKDEKRFYDDVCQRALRQSTPARSTPSYLSSSQESRRVATELLWELLMSITY